MENHPGFNFAELVDGICRWEAKKITYIELAKKTGYDRKLFTRINNRHIPTKVTVITIGVALGLDVEEISKLLVSAGYIFNLSIPIDKAYVEAIKTTDIRDVDRIDSCNKKLKEKGVRPKYLLGSLYVKTEPVDD